MNEILDELPKPKRVNQAYWSYFVFAGLTIFVLAAGIYVGNTLFGKRSLDVMLDLYAQRDTLKHEVSKLQEQNAALQKEYFELKGLDPDSYKME